MRFETSKYSQPDKESYRATRRELWIAKAVLLIMVFGLCVVGRRVALWPIVTWPMYSRRISEFPAASACAVELRVVNSMGDIHILAPSDLIPLDRAPVAEKIIKYAFGDGDRALRDAHRVYLANLAKRALSGAEVETIQGWRVCWEVNPLVVPPLARRHPVQGVLLDSFPASPRADEPREQR